MFLNPARWNSNATLLFLESPSGVGFSYNASDATGTGGTYSTDDAKTAALNLETLVAFFAAYPELRANALFLAGESYAGVYVPMLAQQVRRRGWSGERREWVEVVGWVGGVVE